MDDKVQIRRVSLMSCEIAVPEKPLKGDCAILTFGSDDGGIEQVKLSREAGKQLFHRLALALHRTSLPCGPANIEKVLAQWLVPHTPDRALSNIDGDGDDYLYELRHSIPELADYIDKQLASLHRTLKPKGRSAATADTVEKRVKKMLMMPSIPPG